MTDGSLPGSFQVRSCLYSWFGNPTESGSYPARLKEVHVVSQATERQQLHRTDASPRSSGKSDNGRLSRCTYTHPRMLKDTVLRHNVADLLRIMQQSGTYRQCPSGGIGRRPGLKIPYPSKGVPVRPRSRAPLFSTRYFARLQRT
jgi:hypothetical protein